jgi:two-component system, cell cycle response regulator
MPIVLTVDDSSSIRSIVSKALRELGFEIEQAEDGEKGLALLEETKVDLILLDVTMPVMDGPTMLKALRERGDKTPVIMLTSESKRAIVAGAMQMGIEDYMLKPFKPDELRTKVFKALRMTATTPVAANSEVGASPAPAAPSPTPSASGGAKSFVDVLIVDDMENVHKKFRQTLPAHITMHGAVSAREALTACQEKVFRLVLVDMVIPDVNSVALMNQLRALQPHAQFVALVLRAATDPKAEITSAGFADYLFKPFDPDATSELIGKFFDAGNLLEIEGNVLTAAGFEGKEDKLERYYSKLKTSVKEATEKLAAACFEEAIFDMRNLPLRADRTIRMMIDIDKDTRKLGLQLRLVGSAEAGALLKRVTDTAELPFFTTIDQARDLAA